MVKDRVALPKCLFYVATHTERLMHPNRTVGTLDLVKVAFTNSKSS